MTRLTNKKNIKTIADEWDAICVERDLLIETNKDFSLIGVTVPGLIQQINCCDKSCILDIGCGTGYLTQNLARICDRVIGIDISAKSIEIAKKKSPQNNISFEVSSIEDYSTKYKIKTCVSNMVLMVVPDLEKTINSIYNILEIDGYFVFVITHPCFWPQYWGYSNEKWFDYKKELYIENNFITSLSDPIGVTTHIHRPLQQYFSALIQSGFEITNIVEPYPYLPIPHGYSYEYPRFLLIKCKKNNV